MYSIFQNVPSSSCSVQFWVLQCASDYVIKQVLNWESLCFTPLGTTERVCLIQGTVEALNSVHDFIAEKVREMPQSAQKSEPVSILQPQTTVNPDRVKQVRPHFPCQALFPVSSLSCFLSILVLEYMKENVKPFCLCLTCLLWGWSLVSVLHHLLRYFWSNTYVVHLGDAAYHCEVTFNEFTLYICFLIGIVYPQRKILSSFTTPLVISNLYYFLSFAKHTRYLEDCW